MATIYVDMERALRDLDIQDGLPDNEADQTTLTEIAAEVSRTIELKTGRAWGGVAAATAITVDGSPIGISDLLLLPKPVRSVTSVAIIGTNPLTLASTDWILDNITVNGDAHAIRRINGGGWPRRNGIDRVTVTGYWSDAPNGEEPPAEIVDAATWIAVETYKQRISSPAGEIGPEGFTIRPRNPWVFEVVKTALDRYAGAKAVVL